MSSYLVFFCHIIAAFACAVELPLRIKTLYKNAYKVNRYLSESMEIEMIENPKIDNFEESQVYEGTPQIIDILYDRLLFTSWRFVQSYE